MLNASKNKTKLRETLHHDHLIFQRIPLTIHFRVIKFPANARSISIIFD